MAISAPKSGDMLPPADLDGHLMLVIPTEYVPHVKTTYTKAGEEGDPAIVVDVAVLTMQDSTGKPSVFQGVMWFNVKLYNNLKKQIGETILGRMGQGAAQPGQSAPWQLNDATGEPDALAFANQWLETVEGAHFEMNGQKSAHLASQQASTPQAATPAPAAAPVPTARPAPQVAPVAAPPAPARPVTPAAGFPTQPVGIPSTTSPPVAPTNTGGDLASMLSGLSPAEQQAMLALLQQQNQQ